MERPSQPALGVFWMVVTGLCFVAVTAIVKHVGSTLPSSQAAFMRYAFGMIFMIPMLPAMRRNPPRGRALKLFALRGAFHTAGVVCWFYAMTKLPIAEVTAMNYLSPIYVTLGAALFLGERLALRRITAVVVALIGALIILRPGLRELSPGHYAMLLTAVAFGGSYVSAKSLSATQSPAVVVFMLSITVAIGLAPFAWAVWVPPTLVQAAWLLAVAAFATMAHYAMTLAFRAAPVSVTQPVTFLQLVWAVILGALLFDEPVDQWVVIGGAIIIAAISFITWREAVLKRRGVTPAQVQTQV